MALVLSGFILFGECVVLLHLWLVEWYLIWRWEVHWCHADASWCISEVAVCGGTIKSVECVCLICYSCILVSGCKWSRYVLSMTFASVRLSTVVFCDLGSLSPVLTVGWGLSAIPLVYLAYFCLDHHVLWILGYLFVPVLNVIHLLLGFFLEVIFHHVSTVPFFLDAVEEFFVELYLCIRGNIQDCNLGLLIPLHMWNASVSLYSEFHWV